MKHSSIQDWLMNWFWEINISVKLADFPSLLGGIWGVFWNWASGFQVSTCTRASGFKKKFNPCVFNIFSDNYWADSTFCLFPFTEKDVADEKV